MAADRVRLKRQRGENAKCQTPNAKLCGLHLAFGIRHLAFPAFCPSIVAASSVVYNRIGSTVKKEVGMTEATTQNSQPSVRDKVQDVINLIRPAVQADGGDIELVDVNPAGLVQIRFHGACHGCPSSTMTLQMGIERNLREKIPEVTGVIPVA